MDMKFSSLHLSVIMEVTEIRCQYRHGCPVRVCMVTNFVRTVVRYLRCLIAVPGDHNPSRVLVGQKTTGGPVPDRLLSVTHSQPTAFGWQLH